MRSEKTKPVAVGGHANCWPFAQLDPLATQIMESVPKSRKHALAQRRYVERTTARLRELNDARARPVTVNGIEFPSVAAAANHFGVSRPTAQARVHRGWTYEDAVSTPTQKRKAPTIH